MWGIFKWLKKEEEDLTPEEQVGKKLNYMKKCIEQAKCPDCKNETLKEGPAGGASQNLYCDCGSRFNVGIIGGHVVFVERI